MNRTLNDFFDHYGIKTVTKTDKEKSAYLPDIEQRAAILASGITPSEKKPADSFQLIIINGTDRTSINASFYTSDREGNRAPEYRMGHAFISSWLEKGDEVLIGNIGNELFVLKNCVEIPHIEKAIFEDAQKPKGMPSKKTVTHEVYSRDPFVVKSALYRARGKCEISSCGASPFKKNNGKVFLEVHHIIPLSEKGKDIIKNVAALCPNCHREQHHGAEKKKKRQLLLKEIKDKEF